MTNGLLLIPNLDSLFDKGFISFDDMGRILLSPQLSPTVAEQFGVNSDMCMKRIYPEHQPYLEFHRDEIFRKTPQSTWHIFGFDDVAVMLQVIKQCCRCFGWRQIRSRSK